MAQLMPLSLAVSCFSKIQIGFTFLVPAHLGSLGKGPLNGCVCVCRCEKENVLKVLTIFTYFHKSLGPEVHVTYHSDIQTDMLAVFAAAF